MSKNTLVLVHGFLGSSLNWGPIVSRLQQDLSLKDTWTFRTVDLLWHGKRRGPEEPGLCTLMTMVRDFEEQIQDLNSFVGLGHSFGLRPLLKLSSLKPDKVLSIIAEDSSPEISDQGLKELTKIFNEIPVPFPNREAAKKFLDSMFATDPTMARFLLSNIRESAEGQHGWRFQSNALKWILSDSHHNPLWKEWASYQNPMYIVKGDNEKSFIKKDILERCLNSRAGLITEVYEIPQSGHWVHSEQPDLFAQCLSKILKKID